MDQTIATNTLSLHHISCRPQTPSMSHLHPSTTPSMSCLKTEPYLLLFFAENPFGLVDLFDYLQVGTVGLN